MILILIILSTGISSAQCLSSVNPVGGSSNLLVLEKNSVRLISFYRHNYGNHYYEGDKRSDFNLISSANYNYAGSLIGYGLTERFTIETEFGYFFNKTQKYNLEPSYSLRGSGFSNMVLSFKYGLVKDNSRRFYVSTSLGPKIPFSTKPRVSDGVELPVEVQPTLGAFGMVFQFFVVKEIPLKGTRYFLTSRVESNARNRQEYKLGTAVFSSFYLSRHLMFPWLKGDWTTILQIRNETRGRDKTSSGIKEFSGGTIFFLSPQVNYFLSEKWNISLIVDIPVYQYFNGIQLASKYGFSLNLARDFKL